MQNAFLPGRMKRSVKLAAAPIVCGSEPVMGALENPTSNNHSSVGSSSDKRAFSNSGNLAENVTKKNVQEFSHVVPSPCEPIVAPKSKMFKLQVFVTCQHECSQDCQPQDVPNENILFGVMKCLSQVITKFDNVFAGSSPYENENAQLPNVPMFSPKSGVIYEKSSSENLSREVSIKEIKKDEQLAPESKNKENLEVNIVGAKNNICSECRGIYVASSPDTGGICD